MNQNKNVRQQYADDKNLSARINLHAKHSTNKQGFVPWLFEQYRFSANDSILELGCGNGGQWESRMNHLPASCRLTLSDYSEGMVSMVKEKFSGQFCNVDFMQIDIQDIPFSNESFDIVIANHMLYHVPDLHKALREVSRVLKTGGQFYVATNGNGGMRPFLHEALKKFDPETTAFTQEFSFNLANGKEILAPYFSSVERVDYEDSLAITETQDLMDWIKSTVSISGFLEEKFEGLHKYFETIKRRDGAINIPKEVGLFVCENIG